MSTPQQLEELSYALGSALIYADDIEDTVELIVSALSEATQAEGVSSEKYVEICSALADAFAVEVAAAR